jgi:8-hydroxy-5-deazaflavin:NADPH oxidoreductase
MIGSRTLERGRAAAEEISLASGSRVEGGSNADAARAADIGVVTVPYDGMRDTLMALEPDLRDKIVVCAVGPLKFSRVRINAVDVPAGSAAEEAQAVLPNSRVTAAFHNLPASHLLAVDRPIDGDVVVCADDDGALQETLALAERIEGVRGVRGGPLANSRFVEHLTALILNVNRIYKAEAHVKFIGL